MENLADLPTWLKYGMATGLMLVVLSRVILATDARLRETKTGLIIGNGSVTLTVMLTLAFTGADQFLIEEYLFVAGTGAVLLLWDVARLYARQRAEEESAEPLETARLTNWPPIYPNE